MHKFLSINVQSFYSLDFVLIVTRKRLSKFLDLLVRNFFLHTIGSQITVFISYKLEINKEEINEKYICFILPDLY